MMNDRLYQVLKKGAVILAVGCAYCVWLALTGIGIPCVFHLVTGLKCPGCGVSRMLVALFRLDFRAAFEYNAVLLCMLPLLLALLTVSSVRYVKTGEQKMSRLENGTVWGMVILLLIWGVIRNLPV